MLIYFIKLISFFSLQGKLCSIVVPSLESLWKSSELLRTVYAQQADFVCALRRQQFMFIRMPEAWDDRMIISHACIRDQQPCTVKEAMTDERLRFVRCPHESEDIPQNLWIEVLVFKSALLNTS